jgi:hypothetical protein
MNGRDTPIRPEWLNAISGCSFAGLIASPALILPVN